MSIPIAWKQVFSMRLHIPLLFMALLAPASEAPPSAALSKFEHAAAVKHERVVVIVADLQNPPETIPDLLDAWRSGAQVVWAKRARRTGEKSSTVALANLFYWVMRNVVGMRELAATGADFFLIDRRVINAFQKFSERKFILLALVPWMGFRQAIISYDKEARLHGRPGCSLSAAA